MSVQWFPGEIILLESAANIFRGIEGVGGKIKVTNFRVVFEAYFLNIQSEPEIMPLEYIAAIGPANTWGFIPNGMKIRMSNGAEFHFITWKRQKIMGAIRSLRSGIALL